jgi:hypothetical protein
MAAHRDACLRRCGDRWLALASDNSAGIGWAAEDALPADPYLVGRLTARVAALEVLSLGATPFLSSSTLSFDYESDHGRSLTQGIVDLLAEVSLTQNDLTGSCETNFPARLTCLGVTVLGWAECGRLLLNRVQPGDECYLLGQPLLGPAVLAGWRTLLDLPTVQQLVSWRELHELLPVGSRGIRRELDGLATAYDLGWSPGPTPAADWSASAGPATCLLAIGEGGLGQRLGSLDQPVSYLGRWQAPPTRERK